MANLGTRISVGALAALLVGAALPALAASPGAKCGASRLKAVAKSCGKELACHAKYAKKPEKDPGQTKLDACIGRNADTLTAVLGKIRVRADQQGAVCSITEDGAQFSAGALATATRLGMLTDWDPEAGDAADNTFRASLLRAGGKACKKSLSAVAKHAGRPNETKLDKGLAKALIGFVKAAQKATTRVQKAGGSGLDVDLLQAVVDNVHTTVARLVPAPDVGDAVPFEVSAGNDHTCLRRTDGSVQCWGDNSSGQATAPPRKFLAISAGGAHTCGIRESNDRAECWGADDAGQVSNAPTDELGFVIAAGGAHTCALRVDQTAICWGDDTFGQATPPFPAQAYFDISAGDFHTCAFRADDGKVDCWGRDEFGQSTNPVPDTAFEAIAAGGGHTCGIEIGREVTCWGNTPFPPGGHFFDISAGKNHTCALSNDDSTATCWGAFGPWRAPPDNLSFFDIAAGARHTCAIRDHAASRVTCWGDDDLGQTSCPGVADCDGAAPPPCQIANEGPVVGKVGRITVAEVLNDPENDYRLILPTEYLDLLRDLAPGSELLTSLVGAFDARGFSCDGDDRIAIEFPAEDVEVLALLEEFGVLEPIIGFILDEIIEPIRRWYREQLLAELRKFVAGCIVKLIVFQSSCV